MEILTKLGILKARLIKSKDYPAISVGLKTDRGWTEYCIIEVDQDTWDEPKLNVRVYDAEKDEPVFNLALIEDEIRSAPCWNDED